MWKKKSVYIYAVFTTKPSKNLYKIQVNIQLSFSKHRVLTFVCLVVFWIFVWPSKLAPNVLDSICGYPICYLTHRGARRFLKTSIFDSCLLGLHRYWPNMLSITLGTFQLPIYYIARENTWICCLNMCFCLVFAWYLLGWGRSNMLYCTWKHTNMLLTCCLNMCFCLVFACFLIVFAGVSLVSAVILYGFAQFLLGLPGVCLVFAQLLLGYPKP